MNQSGYSMLLALFILFGIGGLWVGGSWSVESAYHRDRTAELGKARTALISYATNYIDHYGVEGAGPGHLPCPDTDAPDANDGEVVNGVANRKDPWVRDGPNPPCSKSVVESGWLPRHVNTNAGRYHFHTRQRQRIWYAVSGRYINNPLNRVVNPDTVGNIDLGQGGNIVAVLTIPPLYADAMVPPLWWRNSGSVPQGSAYTVIRTSDLRESVMRRVASWTVTRLNLAARERCVADTNGPACQQSTYIGHTCSFNAEVELLFWLSEELSASTCNDIELELRSAFELFDGAPYARHWFVRNGWFDYIDFKISPACLNAKNASCRFVVEPFDAFDNTISMALHMDPGRSF